MQKIYLAKPGAQKEGPYTLEQINHDLATKKISDTDFWAWHDGLPAWTPLYSVPGVSAKVCVVEVPEAIPQPKPVATQVVADESEVHASKPGRNGTLSFKPETVKTTVRVVSKPANLPTLQTAKSNHHPARVAWPEPDAQAVEVATALVVEPKPEGPMVQPATPSPEETDTSTIYPKPNPSEILATPSLSSGKPFAALEQVFVFTTGEGPTALKSEVTAATLAEAVGRKADDIWAKVPVDVVGGTTTGVVEAIRSGSIPGSAWRALFRIKRAVAQQIQDGWYHLCVRTFRLESKDLVAVFLLYNKEKL